MMNVETGRLVFTSIFVLLVFVMWQRWEVATNPPEAASRQGSVSGGGRAGTVPSEERAADPDLPQPTVPLRAGDAAEDGPPVAEAAPRGGGDIVTLSTDWLNLRVSSDGGSIVGADLRKHHVSNRDDTPFRLLDDERGLYVAQSGLIGGDLPNHKSSFSIIGPTDSPRTPGASGKASVILEAETDSARVQKTVSVEDSSYIVGIRFSVLNTGDAPLTVLAYHQFLHDGEAPPTYSAFLPTYFGAAVHTEEDRFNKVALDDFRGASYPRKSADGWVGIIERYFMTAWLGAEGEREFYLRDTQAGHAVGTIVPVGVIAPGERAESEMPVYIGAQEQESLSELSESGVAPGIDLAVDYGFLTIIAAPMFWMLARFNDVVGNWGIAIILITFLIKLAFFPLSAASYRSMAKLRAVSPRIQRLREKHGDDKQAMQRAMMELYREEKINPFGGCLPILVQIPFFIALYWVLLGSVELRNAPFFLWITDLASPDPWFVMSVLLGALMFAQTKLNPTPPDPTQAMIVKFIPLVFTGFSVFFPSGLVLYWVVNTLLSILQQWQITRVVGTEKAHARRS